MNDAQRTTYAVDLYATGLWIIGIGLILTGMTLDLIEADSDWQAMSFLGIVVAMGGATLTVKGYLVRVCDRFGERERHAFDMGREVGRSESEDLRRIH